MAVDDLLGRMMEVLERSGKLEDTVIVLTSDQGYFYGEHGLNAERRLACEETIRIPLRMRYPPLIAAGTIPEKSALTIDLAPTLLELAGVAVDRPLHGRSLVPLLSGHRRPGAPPSSSSITATPCSTVNQRANSVSGASLIAL